MSEAMEVRRPGEMHTMGLDVLRTTAARIARVIRLDASVFSEVAADRGATYQALVVVFLGAGVTAAALGGSWDVIPAQFLLAYIGWIAGSLLAYGIGRYVFKAPTQADWTTVARALGFAHAPLLLRALAVLPGVGVAMFLLTAVWQGIAMVMALKHGVGYPTYWKPVGIQAAGFLPYVLVMASFNWLL